MYGPQHVCTLTRARRHDKVIMGIRATTSMCGWLRHAHVQSDHYIRYRRLGLTLSVYIIMGRER